MHGPLHTKAQKSHGSVASLTTLTITVGHMLAAKQIRGKVAQSCSAVRFTSITPLSRAMHAEPIVSQKSVAAPRFTQHRASAHQVPLASSSPASEGAKRHVVTWSALRAMEPQVPAAALPRVSHESLVPDSRVTHLPFGVVATRAL